MGIPSYYKKLTDTHPGLVLDHHPSDSVSWLFMDFNCLIYHCIQQPDMIPYDETDNTAWENELLQRVVEYTEHIIHTVAPEDGVFLAIDGVVPMAKMRQQRLRRFKSQWLKHKTEKATSWDTNAITPGTLFMEKLHTALENASLHSNKQWIISNSNQPGEGEHKIIAEWKTRNKQYIHKNHAVYGLDADLIILTLLTREILTWNNNKIWLFREAMDKGACVYQNGQECFEWFCIHELRKWLVNGLLSEKAEREWIMSYCLAMSVLGNDFIPRALSFTLRDDGHAELLARLRMSDLPLVDTETLSIYPSALFSFFKQLATDESERMQQTLLKRKRMSQIYGTTEIGLGESNWPLSQMEEQVLMSYGKLKDNWENAYLYRFFHMNDAYAKKQICNEYLYGIQWIWAYYTGKTSDVCYDWYYPHSLPPLWSWINQDMPAFPESVKFTANNIQPYEQLGLVLPPNSWHLIRNPLVRSLRKHLPHYFPADFSFESVGKRYFWECDAIIPVPSLAEIKSVLSRDLFTSK